ncbi:energy transducer TonB [Vibrio sinaloensis]|uniref:energy transducer TonB n=1 Tax=Photobacterium sp. (strain ATCC 43367) TaxID=379097 RepID=UPI0022AF75BA|nr:energy transducer TonB [Vibrio sinaloensis]MCZ4292759.1 TonB family protein [Vibrio sinaloensis]
MNIKRYVVAAGLSVAVHAALVVVTQEPKAMAMPAGSPSNSVSLNLKMTAPPSSIQPVVEQKAQIKAQPKLVESSAVKQEKNLAKPKPKPKPVDTVKTPVSKQQSAQQKPDQTAENQRVAKQEKKPLVAPQPEQASDDALPQDVNDGVNLQPVMVTKASFLTKPTAPKYPRLAKKRRLEGVVLYEVWLDKNGNQVKQVLISSSGATILDQSALDAIKTWQFSPQSVDGQQIAHRIQIPVRFKLDQ